MNDNIFDKALEDALVMLSMGFKTRQQIIEKLEKKGHTQPVCERVCNHLEDNKYLDDALYAQLFIESKSKKYGGFRLKQALKQKGISLENIEKGFNTSEGVLDETQRATLLLEQKINNTPIEWERLKGDFEYKVKVQNKLLSFLASRGFSSTVVYSVVRNRLAEQFVDEF